MPISSLIVHTHGEAAASDVARAVGTWQGVSVEGQEGANLILITETTYPQEDKVLWDQLELLEGVASVELVYHNFEDVEGTAE